MAKKKTRPQHLLPADLRGLRVARYLRCSTDEQSDNEYSTIDVQDELTLRHIIENGGLDAGRYADEGKTGTDLERPDWRRMLTDARDKKFDAVCVTFMSRLGRGDAFPVAEYLLWESKVGVALVKETFLPGMGGYLAKQATKLIDGMYPEFVKEWTLTKMEQMFRSGYYVGGGIPLGYKTESVPGAVPNRNGKVPRLLAPDENTSPLILQAFQTFLVTRSVTKTADVMAAATGRSWSNSQTVYLLRNRTYLGEGYWNGITVPEHHQALIESALFDAAQKVLSANAEQRASGRVVRAAHKPSAHAAPEEKHAYYLRGRMFCGCCSSRMTTKDATGRGGKTVHYYECLRLSKYREGAGEKDGGAKGCSIKRINADTIHTALVEEIGRMAAHPWRIRTHIETAAAVMPRPQVFEEAAEAARKRLKECMKRLDKLTDAIAIGGAAVVAALARKIASEEGTRTTLLAEVERLDSEAARARAWKPNADLLSQVMQAFTAMWQHLDDEERTNLLSLLVDQVEMVGRRRAVVTLLPLVSSDLIIPSMQIASGSSVVAARSLVTLKQRTGERSDLNRSDTSPVFSVSASGHPLIGVSSGLPITLDLPPIGGRKKREVQHV